MDSHATEITCWTPWVREFDLLCNKLKTSCIVNKAVKKANNHSMSDVLE